MMKYLIIIVFFLLVVPPGLAFGGEHGGSVEADVDGNVDAMRGFDDGSSPFSNDGFGIGDEEWRDIQPDGVDKKVVNAGQQTGERAFMHQFTEMLGAPSDASRQMWWGENDQAPPPESGSDTAGGNEAGQQDGEGSIIDQVESVIPIA